MRYLKEYYNYDSEVAKICRKYGIRNWSIKNGLVDVDVDVDLSNSRLNKLPLKFGKVGGYFDCRNNKLTTLEGGPSEVNGYFYCGGNQLTSLKGGPSEVNGDFYCGSNQLTTLQYFPRVRGSLEIDNNPLPKEIYDNEKYLKKIIEYGPEYDIWRDGELYMPRFNSLMIDIREGL